MGAVCLIRKMVEPFSQTWLTTMSGAPYLPLDHGYERPHRPTRKLVWFLGGGATTLLLLAAAAGLMHTAKVPLAPVTKVVI